MQNKFINEIEVIVKLNCNEIQSNLLLHIIIILI